MEPKICACFEHSHMSHNPNVVARQICEFHHLVAPDEPQRDYTPEEALAEAQKRWGRDARINCHSEGEPLWMTVGVFGKFFYGQGASFRAAFAEADKQEGK